MLQFRNDQDLIAETIAIVLRWYLDVGCSEYTRDVDPVARDGQSIPKRRFTALVVLERNQRDDRKPVILARPTDVLGTGGHRQVVAVAVYLQVSVDDFDTLEAMLGSRLNLLVQGVGGMQPQGRSANGQPI